ncbi:MAG: mannose-1-phosphate guanylyltransferase/mannose-6-phosphate isomerase [Candidatus Portnoybacteria bacterium]|nr:mannose-1-phosphate guanylyltransferase/mannose-6-phosphate isomerase [Candidatus Portnoybacteria bacterium]
MANSSKSYLFGVVLAGGNGSRLWPVSRELFPKHLLSINDAQSLLQATVTRIEKLIPPRNISIVTNQKHLPDIKTQLNFFERSQKGMALEQLISEPCGRNTAPAIALAAMRLYLENPESIMIVLPSDHLIQEEEKFLELLKYSLQIAVKGYLVTFGIVPSSPETGYGYIKKGELIAQQANKKAYLADGFFEKPNQELAKEYLDSGQYFWNSGIFVWKTKEILRAIKIFLPDVFGTISEISTLELQGDKNAQIEEIYQNLEPISIDKGCLEKSDKIVVIPAQINWNDIGSWDKILQVLPKDGKGNFIKEGAINVGCENSLILSNERLTAAIGLKDIAVVDTKDALLICHLPEAQKVRNVFNDLLEKQATEAIEPKSSIRPWGQWSIIEEGLGYKIKKIIVNPGQSLSLQAHKHRSEYWIITQGRAEIEKDEDLIFLNKNQTIFLPLGCCHRLSNPGQDILEIIEIQTGDYLGEDDIVRFQDRYGRT